MADGTSFGAGTGTGTGHGIAGCALALALDEPGIQRLARQAAAIAIGGDRILRRGWVKVGRDHVERVREKIESAAAQIVRDYLYSTPRGLRRATRQRRAGANPASVLIPERLAAVVANALRDARRPPRAGRRAATWQGIKPVPKSDRGDPGMCSAKRSDAAEIEIADGDDDADPLLWLLALDARAEAEAEGRAAAPPAPRMRPRRPKPILHLRRAAAGGAP